MPKEPWTTTRDSTWATRAWTFQEELLSRRRLIFSEEQVSLICHEMVCCEARGGAEFAGDAESTREYSTASLNSARFDKYESISRILKRTGDAAMGAEVGISGKDTLRDVMDLLTEYSVRKLTKDSDALRAFAGIFRVFERGDHPIYNVQGLPVMNPVELSSSGCSALNLAALCWEHFEPGEARCRTEFPSWTWAGWTSRIGFPYNLEQSPEFELAPQFVLFEYQDGHKVNLETLALGLSKAVSERRQLQQFEREEESTENTEKDFSKPTIIQLHAPVLSAEHFSFTDPTDWVTGSFAGMPFCCRGGPLKNDDMPFSPMFFINGLATGHLGCVLLRIDKDVKLRDDPRPSSGTRAHILLLQWHEGAKASRIAKLKAVTRKVRPSNFAERVGELEYVDVQLI